MVRVRHAAGPGAQGIFIEMHGANMSRVGRARFEARYSSRMLSNGVNKVMFGA